VYTALLSDDPITVQSTHELLGDLPDQGVLHGPFQILYGIQETLIERSEEQEDCPSFPEDRRSCMREIEGSCSERSVNCRFGSPSVNIDMLWPLFLYRQLQYLLSNRELFARFFDQYARMYFAQEGKPYGQTVRPGDASEQVVADNAGHLLQALREAQLQDWADSLGAVAEREVENTVVSTGLALGMLIAGVFTH
jgi:hypothetical protein